ncbi:hypothetical protein F4824DRAFT_448665 [Ustulina deusta]|nr:hypothetical protein F4824DRAFT_448665 [Ustulina deusta]
MQLPIIIMVVLGTVSALPGSIPVITAAPELKGISASTSADHTSTSCTSTDCWASYAECNGSLTFVYLCYTPPPCGTVTSPDPYSCPPPKPSSQTTVNSTPLADSTTTTFTTSTASSKSAAPTAPVACSI